MNARTPRWKLAAAPLAVVCLTSPILVNCDIVKSTVPGAADVMDAASGCPEMESGNFANIAASADPQVKAKVVAFLDASYTLDKIVAEMEANLDASCTELGKALKVSDQEMAKAKQDDGVEGLCAVVSTKLDAFLKGDAAGKLAIEVGEPTCYVPIDATMECLGNCGAVVEAGKLEASCEGGEIAGKCSGECSGTCTVEAGGSCSGECGATCKGSCEAGFSGTCGGNCEGKCDGKDASGACEGNCEGKCDAQAEGSCTGSCEGSCTATCEMKGEASCEGTCSGGCSVEVEEPKCTGEFKPPNVDPTCHLSCAAKTAGKLKCDPPSVQVVVKGEANAELTEVVAALQVALPKIVEINVATGQRLAGTATGLVEGAVGLKDVAAAAGAKALVCITFAAEAATSASLNIETNVSASASVSGSAGI